MDSRRNCVLGGILAVMAILTMAMAGAAPQHQAVDAAPPDHVVKLIFIHHSTGENWLRDDYGRLGRALGESNYFVTETNYGWGPDDIGDRTDIPNWPEWFSSERTPVYMQALYEATEYHTEYTRTLPDPGGENEIILFKSCFPNSALEGSPDDAPDPEQALSVGHAKYVYNEILGYFATRPDKLFVVITAPPLTDGTYAENARAFNNWLRNDWLFENNYALSNVAVFDFYNVLTSPEAHHRVVDGQIEYTSTSRNTLYYPSGDDHPSEAGSQKATEEFVPLLNAFYNRWQASEPGVPSAEQPQALASDTPIEQTVEQPAAQPVMLAGGVLDDFEAGPLTGTSGWEAYFQDNTDTRLDCAPDGATVHQGAGALKIDFDVAADSWATCGFYFGQVQDWSGAEGVAFYLRASREELPFAVNVYGGTPGGMTTYYYDMQSEADAVDGWAVIDIRWDSFRRAEWEENPGTEVNPAEVTGFSFGLSTPVDSRLEGTLWVDELHLVGGEEQEAEPPVQEPATPVEENAPEAEVPEAEPTARNPLLPCASALLLPLILLLWKVRLH